MDEVYINLFIDIQQKMHGINYRLNDDIWIS